MVLVLAIFLIVAGLGLVGAFAFSQQTPPVPSSSQDSSYIAPMHDNGGAETLPYAIPVSVHIPAIDVRAEVIALGQKEDGTLEVPSQDDADKAAWYNNSPTPGQAGSSVVQGHVDYVDQGPAVFFDLGRLTPGDTIEVTREDGKTAVFTVHRTELHKREEFPTQQVYGSTDRPELVLITCGGDFNREADEFDSNTIIYSTLTEIR